MNVQPFKKIPGRRCLQFSQMLPSFSILTVIIMLTTARLFEKQCVFSWIQKLVEMHVMCSSPKDLMVLIIVIDMPTAILFFDVSLWQSRVLPPRVNRKVSLPYMVNMRALDGIQGPMYVGTGCVFNRQALYGYSPPSMADFSSSRCCCPSNKSTKDVSQVSRDAKRAELDAAIYNLKEIDNYDEHERSMLISQMSFEKTFGLSTVFIESTLLENGGVPESADPSMLIKEAVHVISCGYEEKTEWGKEIGWIYGSVTEDILTGFKMQCRGWTSIYCMPLRPAFKGSAPINLSDRLHQVLRWALGSVEIFLSRHCPLWYAYAGGRLKWLQRLAYINTIVYPFTFLLLLIVLCLLFAFSQENLSYQRFPTLQVFSFLDFSSPL